MRPKEDPTRDPASEDRDDWATDPIRSCYLEGPELHQLAVWVLGEHAGLSAKSMARVALGLEPYRWDHPYDRGDFGRCMYLVDTVPGIRKAFDAIAKVSPQWAVFIARWDELTELHKRGDWALLNSQISELLKSCNP